MDLHIRMTDTETGEILYHQHKVLACHFDKRDTGFNLLHKVCESCVRGVRLKHKNGIELLVRFSEDSLANSAQLPFFNGDPF